MFPTSWHRSRTGRVVQRLSIIPRARVTIRRLADPTTQHGRPDVWPGPPPQKKKKILEGERLLESYVSPSQRPSDTRFAPPHMHTVIRKTARSLACLLRNFGPFLPLLIVLFPLLPVIPPGLHPSCQMFQLPPIVVRLSGNICSRSEESPPGARSSLVIGETRSVTQITVA